MDYLKVRWLIFLLLIAKTSNSVLYAFNKPDTLITNPPTIGLSISSFGAGIEVCINNIKTKKTTFRGGIELFQYKREHQIELDKGSFVNINPKIGLAQLNNYFDFYPFKKERFRLTGGLAYTIIQKYDAFFNSTTGLKIGGMQIASEDFGNIKFNIIWNKLRPYIGIGLGNHFQKKKIGITADIGCFYLGKPELNLQYEGFLESTTIDEGIKKIEYNMRGYRFYPNLSIQVRYKLF